MKYNLDLLKEVLSVPTATYKEDLMIEFLEKWLSENNIPHYTDSHGNVYATKEDNQFDEDGQKTDNKAPGGPGKNTVPPKGGDRVPAKDK